MAEQNSLPALLTSLTAALNSARDDSEQLKAPIPVQDGISLLDVKNEIFLSYLHNLVFLIILKLRNRNTDSDGKDEDLNHSVVKKLVELQVYTEKGARPLENRLKYQIESIKPREQPDTVDLESVSEEDSRDDTAFKAPEINDLQYRPNPAAFTQSTVSPKESSRQRSEDGIYKPPRIQPTVMPTTGPKVKEAKKPSKSATVEEFIHSEMSIMPTAEPSIGSTILNGGRKNKSENERKEEKERREYEERNYVRLPKETKKDRAKKKATRQNVGYGGEEWRGLGEGINRIERLTQRKSQTGRSVLDKSRKRSMEDKIKAGGSLEVGERFQKRLKMLDGGRRDRGRK